MFPAQAVINEARRTHSLAVALAERSTEDQFIWRPGSGMNSIAFHLWHLARWADHLQSRLPQMTQELHAALGDRPEIWKLERLAERWGFSPELLGHDETGMLMDDNQAALLPLPAQAALIEYARRAFQAAEEAVSQIPSSEFACANDQNPDETIAEILASHMQHDARHLGMMECLLGLQGTHGTATR